MVDVGVELGLDYGELTSLSVAQSQIDVTKLSRNARHKRVDHFIATLDTDARRKPPKIVHGVVRIQSAIRSYLFRRNRVSFSWPVDFRPPHPEVSLALHLGRRLRSPDWVDLLTEARIVADLHCGKHSRDLRELFIIHKLHVLYSQNLDSRNVAVIILREKEHMMIVSVQESLQADLLQLQQSDQFTPGAVHERIEAYKPLVPTDMREGVFEFATSELTRIFEETEAAITKELRYSVKVPELEKLEKKVRRLFGDLPNRELSAVRNAKLQRREFLIYELQTSWEWPLVGAVPQLKASGREYLAELKLDDEPVMQHFVGDVINIVNKLRDEVNARTASYNAQLTALRVQAAKARVKHMKTEIEREMRLVVEEAMQEMTKLARSLGADEVLEMAKVLLVGKDYDDMVKRLAEVGKGDAFVLARLCAKEPQLKEVLVREGAVLATEEELKIEDSYYEPRVKIGTKVDESTEKTLETAAIANTEEFVKYKNTEYKASTTENPHAGFFAKTGDAAEISDHGFADTGLYQQLFAYRQEDAPDENVLASEVPTAGVVKVVLAREMTTEERGSLLRVWLDLCEYPVDNMRSVGAKQTEWFLELSEHVDEFIAETKIQKLHTDALNVIESINKLSIDDLWTYDSLKRTKATEILTTVRKPQPEPSVTPAPVPPPPPAGSTTVSGGRPLYVSIDPLNAKKTSEFESSKHPLYTFYDVRTMGPINPIELKFNPRARFFLTRLNPSSSSHHQDSSASVGHEHRSASAGDLHSGVRAPTASL